MGVEEGPAAGVCQGNPRGGRSLPSRKEIRADALTCSGAALFSGVGVNSILPTESRSTHSGSAVSHQGADQAQGPHQEAQKSTEGGAGSSTSSWKLGIGEDGRQPRGLDQVPRLYDPLRRSGIRGVATGFRACDRALEVPRVRNSTSATLTVRRTGVWGCRRRAGQGTRRLPRRFFNAASSVVPRLKRPPGRRTDFEIGFSGPKFGSRFAARLLLENLLSI